MAKIITSSEDLRIYDNDKHLKIYAGPGAGKTHLLIENIKFIIANSMKLKNSNRKILCITYTNAAADEIKKRLGSYNRYAFVSTIHSFLNEFVIKAYQVQLKKIIKDEFGYDISPKINITSQQEGYSTLRGHKKDDIYEWVSKHYNKLPPELYITLSKSRMSDVIIDISLLNTYMNPIRGKVKLAEVDKITNEVGTAIKEYVWGVAGKLDFDEILYFGLRLLEEYNHIPHMLRVEFPYILIDEYQDTNPIQNKIVRKITQKECVVAAIGDIAQSIYSFQGATYKEFENLKLDSPLPIESYVIKGNRRSTQNIIDFLNFIRKSDPELNDQKCEMNISSNEKVTFIIQKNRSILSRDLNDIIGTTDYKVLCRKWAEAFDYVKDIDPEQKKLLNAINGAYTYVMHRDLATEIEAKQEAWISSAINIVELEDALKRKCVPSALNLFEKFIDIKEILYKYDSTANERFIKMINLWETAFSDLKGTLLVKDVVKIVNKTLDDSGLPIIEHLAYPEKDDDDYIEAVYKHVDKLNLAAVRKLIKEVFSDDSKYMTIHRAKGTEHEVVLINLEPFKDESKLFTPVDILCSPEVFSNNSKFNEMYKEFTRIAYVGCSRAIDKLYIHLVGDETTRTKIDNAIKTYYCNDQEKCKFYDFEFC